VPVYKTRNQIELALKLFNERAHNAGFEFKVKGTGNQHVQIEASFDFAYYINVRLDFYEVIYTNLKAGQSWPDAWHSDQISMLTSEEFRETLRVNGIKFSLDTNGFALCFKITDDGNRTRAVVIFKTMSIEWISPAYEE
jgi:hypothetical protein